MPCQAGRWQLHPEVGNWAPRLQPNHTLVLAREGWAHAAPRGWMLK